MKKIKILYTIPNFITAGSGRVMVNILEGLDPQRFAPSVCVLKRGGNIEAELKARDIPLLELPFTVPPKSSRTSTRAWPGRSLRACRGSAGLCGKSI